MNKITRMIWVMGVLTVAEFCLSSCDHTLDVQTAFLFEVETMPERKEIGLGETAEIRVVSSSRSATLQTLATPSATFSQKVRVN